MCMFSIFWESLDKSYKRLVMERVATEKEAEEITCCLNLGAPDDGLYYIQEALKG